MMFDLVRLVLVSRKQTSLFEARRSDSSAFDREDWLRFVLGSEFQFVHRNIAHTYKHIEYQGQFIIAKIGWDLLAIENKPPEQGFDKIRAGRWPAATPIVDPTYHPDGQKVAFEHVPKLGQPAGLLKAVPQARRRRPSTLVAGAP